MFPKAPRFVEKGGRSLLQALERHLTLDYRFFAVVDGPAPGDYDPNLPGEPDPHKRGAFLEKTARFRESQNAPGRSKLGSCTKRTSYRGSSLSKKLADTFGLYDPSAPGPSTASKPRPRPSAPVNVAADRERAKKEASLPGIPHREDRLLTVS